MVCGVTWICGPWPWSLTFGFRMKGSYFSLRSSLLCMAKRKGSLGWQGIHMFELFLQALLQNEGLCAMPPLLPAASDFWGASSKIRRALVAWDSWRNHSWLQIWSCTVSRAVWRCPREVCLTPCIWNCLIDKCKFLDVTRDSLYLFESCEEIYHSMWPILLQREDYATVSRGLWVPAEPLKPHCPD